MQQQLIGWKIEDFEVQKSKTYTLSLMELSNCTTTIA